jgi:hypothetical protein
VGLHCYEVCQDPTNLGLGSVSCPQAFWSCPQAFCTSPWTPGPSRCARNHRSRLGPLSLFGSFPFIYSSPFIQGRFCRTTRTCYCVSIAREPAACCHSIPCPLRRNIHGYVPFSLASSENTQQEFSQHYRVCCVQYTAEYTRTTW